MKNVFIRKIKYSHPPIVFCCLLFMLHIIITFHHLFDTIFMTLWQWLCTQELHQRPQNTTTGSFMLYISCVTKNSSHFFIITLLQVVIEATRTFKLNWNEFLQFSYFFASYNPYRLPCTKCINKVRYVFGVKGKKEEKNWMKNIYIKKRMYSW